MQILQLRFGFSSFNLLLLYVFRWYRDVMYSLIVDWSTTMSISTDRIGAKLKFIHVSVIQGTFHIPD